MAAITVPQAILERFCEKFQTSNGCWLWTSSVDHNGYGQFRIKNRIEKAHRVAWQMAHGQITDNLHVLHRCNNPRCVNPEHLFLGTHQDNMRDRNVKSRLSKGAKNGQAKLTEADILTIRSMHANGIRQCLIAKQFNVTEQAISAIVLRKLWRHI